MIHETLSPTVPTPVPPTRSKSRIGLIFRIFILLVKEREIDGRSAEVDSGNDRHSQ